MKVWIAGLFCVLALLAMTACGGDDDDDTGPNRAIETLTEHTVDAWASDGPVAIYNVLHQDVMAECSKADFLAAMDGEQQPTEWRETKDITLQDSSHATATVVFRADGQDVQQSWSFELENDVRWRVSNVPKLSECTGS